MLCKWTIRNIPHQIIDMLREVQEMSGVNLGILLSEAVRYWYQDLPEVEVDADMSTDTEDAESAHS